MSIRAGIYDFVGSRIAKHGTIRKRFYLGFAPKEAARADLDEKNVAFPYVVFGLSLESSEDTIDGPPALFRWRVTFNVVSAYPPDVEPVTLWLRDLLLGINGEIQFGDAKIQGITLAGEDDTAELPETGEEKPMFITAVGFFVTEHRTPPPRIF